MKCLFHRKSMLRAIAEASRAINAKATKPVLKYLLLTADPEDGSTIAGTDLEIGLRLRVLGVKVDSPGRCLVAPERLQVWLNAVPDEEVSLESDAEGLTVRSLRAHTRLPGEDVTLYPEWPDTTPADHFAVNAQALRAAINRTVFCCDVDSTRYALGGIAFAFDGETLCVVGTDGRRLAEQTLELEVVGSPPIPGVPHVLPQKAAKALAALIDDDATPTLFAFDGSSVRFVVGAGTVYARLVEGRYPAFKEVFPAGTPKLTVPVDVPELEALLAAGSSSVGDDSRGVDLSFSEDGLSAESKAADRGQSRAEMPLLCAVREAIPITIDPTYLMPALKAIGDAPAQLLIWDRKNPLILKTDDGYRMVVMPLTRER